MNTDKKLILSIYSKTWSRDSHGLFDYECTSTKNKYVYVFGNSQIFRNQNEISQAASNNEGLEEAETLFGIDYQTEQYSLQSPVEANLQPTEANIHLLQDKIWMIIKSENGEQSSNVNSPNYEALNDFHNIQLNDIIKLGRVKYVITELNLEQSQTGSKKIFDLIHKYGETSDAEEGVTCKICLGTENETDNPLISLCACKGSIGMLHLGCLKKWIQSKLSSKANATGTIVNYSIKTFNCELCKVPYPLRFNLNGSTHDLIDLERPQHGEYFVMESLTQVKDQNNFKSIHVISLEPDQKIMLVIK